MAKSNRDRVGEIMDLLKDGLGPYVLRQYKFVYKVNYLKEMELIRFIILARTASACLMKRRLSKDGLMRRAG